MKAEVIAIGSELTCGARLDTNSQWLSRELESLGWTVHRHTTVADDRDSMIRLYQEAAARSRLVIITGGLGPTLDDITRECLAAAFDQSLVTDDAALRHIESLFKSRNREMPQRNQVQALRPQDAQSIHNAHGTAPGILLLTTDPECTFVALPGVPAEMKLMFHEQVVRLLPQSDVVVRRSLIRTFGFGESDVEQQLGDLTARGRNPEVGITASKAVISLSITARAGSTQECDLLTGAVREQIVARLGPAIFGEGDIDLYQVVADELVRRQLRVALLEGPTTGGLIGQWLTEHDHWAQQVSFSQLFPVLQPTAPAVDDAEAGTWQHFLRTKAQELLSKHAADYVLMSSPSCTDDNNGVRRQCGSVLVLGPDLDTDHDVSMTGNLSIFRQRAARTALNLLRLHLVQQTAG